MYSRSLNPLLQNLLTALNASDSSFDSSYLGTYTPTIGKSYCSPTAVQTPQLYQHHARVLAKPQYPFPSYHRRNFLCSQSRTVAPFHLPTWALRPASCIRKDEKRTSRLFDILMSIKTSGRIIAAYEDVSSWSVPGNNQWQVGEAARMRRVAEFRLLLHCRLP